MFAPSALNTGRQVCLDFAKVFALFWMVLSHPFEYAWLDVSQGLPWFITFIGAHALSAPVFMLCMGIGCFLLRNAPAGLVRQVVRIASDVQRIYLLQWLIIIWIIAALLVNVLHVPFTNYTLTLAGFGVLLASVYLARVRPFSKIRL